VAYSGSFAWVVDAFGQLDEFDEPGRGDLPSGLVVAETGTPGEVVVEDGESEVDRGVTATRSGSRSALAAG
jgi:hypothetical protein